tara:strand:- start:3284 stop:3841 length:558 start_codon:yes stop_codon:yes gene_type:complete
MSKPILFYSKIDQRCINLWNQLKNSGNLDSFVKICVDNNNKIPKIITTIPSIFVKSRGVISGPAIPMYLNSLRNNVPQIPVEQGGNPSPHPSFGKINNNISSNNSSNSNELSDFNPVEMSDQWSDSYSFIQEKSQPISFSFQLLNDNQENMIQSTNEKQDSSDPKRRQDDFQSRLDQLQTLRNQM